MLHIGIGETQLNNLLSTINLPTITKNTLKEREREVGSAVERVSKQCIQNALDEEINASTTNKEGITGSVDAGWQSRGSGKSYKSLSGHATIIGAKTGKIIGLQTRVKTCRTCEEAEKGQRKAKEHSCRRNWSGSSKAMEADMVVSMVKKINSENVDTKITTIVGDEDSSIISRVNNEIDRNIQKKSDANHLKKIVGNQLFTLKKSMKISVKTIKYIQKLFAYMCIQKQGKPDAIERELDAMYKHPYDDHSSCSTSWCKHNQKGMKFASLPYGKPLTDTNLQQSLKNIFVAYKPQARKLSEMESTQANENFNSIVSSKAPKSRHFSGSESLDFRVCAAASQKNKGYNYLVDVNKNIQLSPGSYTEKRIKFLDNGLKTSRQKKKQREVKRQRIIRKAKRMALNAAKEFREGDTYKTSINLETENLDTFSIPDPAEPPCVIPVEKMKPMVFFDLETTGLGRKSHITQIAAVSHSGLTFNCYVNPNVPIQSQASEVTGLTFNATQNQMFYRNQPVPSIPIKMALQGFFNFIGDSPVLLVGHNIKAFDCHVLLNAVQSCDLLPEMEMKIAGFLDTLQLLKSTHPSLESYKQTSLYNHFVGKAYEAHNALADVKALKDIFSVALTDISNLKTHTFQAQYVQDVMKYNENKARNLTTWQPMIQKSVISKGMAGKAAASGLTLEHLRIAYQRNGQQGIESLLSESQKDGKVRVTKNKKVLAKIFTFFQ